MNNQTTPMLFPYEPDELWEKIRELLRSELQKVQTNIPQSVSYEVAGLVKKPLYKAHEVCQMLGVSRQTLYTWVKEGILRQYKIKSRVFFLWKDIEILVQIEPS